MTTIVNQLINLNSADATLLNGTFLSNVSFKFPSLITPKKNIKNITCSVLNAQIPYSYYNVNVYNNIFKIDNGTGVQTITITRGNYNANTLISEIIYQLSLAGISGVSITLSSFTGVLTWTTSAPSMTIISSGSTALKFLGLNTTSNTTSVSQKIVSPYPLNLLYTLKIRITSTALNIDCLDSSVSGSLNVLASFSVSAANFGVILYENQTNIQSVVTVRDLNGFDIRILDDDSNLINLNNVNWTATMMLQVEYEPEGIENPFLANIGIPNQQFWGSQPAPLSIANISNNASSSNAERLVPLDRDNVINDANTDLQPQDEMGQTTTDTSENIPTGTLPETYDQIDISEPIILPSNEINPDLQSGARLGDDNNDLEILLWNNHINS